MDVILIHGLWLDSGAWDDVVPRLEAAGHTPVAVALPGQGDGRVDATLDGQLAAAVAAVDAAAGPALVVGHSAACTLAWLVADRRPEKVAKVALVGGFPRAEGDQYAPFFEPVDGLMGFPGWEPFEGPDYADLSEERKQQMQQDAHPVPAGVAQAEVHYTSPDRYHVPVALVCPEYSPEQAKEWFEAGEMPELKPSDLSYVDIDSGHWPMYSAPQALAGLVDDLAGA